MKNGIIRLPRKLKKRITTSIRKYIQSIPDRKNRPHIEFDIVDGEPVVWITYRNRTPVRFINIECGFNFGGK